MPRDSAGSKALDVVQMVSNGTHVTALPRLLLLQGGTAPRVLVHLQRVPSGDPSGSHCSASPARATGAQPGGHRLREKPPWTLGNILFLTGREKDGAGAKVHFGSLVLRNFLAWRGS